VYDENGEVAAGSRIDGEAAFISAEGNGERDRIA
jgi:hypothetical protein